MNTLFPHTIIAIAKHTFKETVRNKILYGILVFALVYMLFTLFLASISLGEDLHVIRSLGLAGIYLFSVIITVFLGTSLLYKDVERRTLYFVLSKPVSRAHIIIGKFLGLLASVTVSVIGMACIYVVMVAWKGGGFDTLALLALFYQLLELALLIALSIFFSTFAPPLASTLYAVLTLYIGHSLELVLNAATTAGPVARIVAQAIYYILPNLAKFDIRTLVIYDAHIPISQTLIAIVYAFLYVTILLYAAILFFKKQEL